MAVLKGYIKAESDFDFTPISEYGGDYLRNHLKNALSPNEASQVYDAIYNTLDSEGRELYYTILDLVKDTRSRITDGFTSSLMPNITPLDDGRVLVRDIYISTTLPESESADLAKNFKAIVRGSKLAKLKKPNKYGVSVVKATTTKEAPSRGMTRFIASFNLVVE